MNEKKQYIVQIPGKEHVAYWDEDTYAQNEQKLYADYPDAQVTSMSVADPWGDMQDNDQFAIAIPGKEHVAQWDGKTLMANRDRLFQDYPEAKVSRLNNETLQRDIDFVQQYDDASSQWSVENWKFTRDNADRYKAVIAKYSQPQEETIEEEPKKDKGSFIERAGKLFRGLNQGTYSFKGALATKQAVMNTVAGLMDAGVETLRGAARNLQLIDETVWEDAYKEYERRKEAGEPLFRNDAEPSTAEKAKWSKDDARAYERDRQINKIINHLQDKAEKEGVNPDESVENALKRATESSYSSVIQDAADKIRENNSIKLTGLSAKIGEMLPLIGTSIAGVELAASGNLAGAKALGDITMATWAASSAGSAMKQARDNGANDAQTMASGIATAAIMYGIGKIPFNRAISKAVSSSAARSIANVPWQGLEKEMDILYTDAVKNGILVKEEAGKILLKDLVKNVAGQTASSSASFATMNALQALIPLIYEDPEKYPVLANVVNAAKEGAVDGLLLGALTGGFSSGRELSQRIKRWEGRDYVSIAEVDFGGKAPAPEDVLENNPRTGRWEQSSMEPGQAHFAEIINPNEKEGFAWARINEGGRQFLVKVRKGDIRIGKVIGFGEAKAQAESSYTEQGFTQGREAETPEQRESIRTEQRYITEKASREAQAGGVTEGTQLDLDRANAAMEGRRDAVLSEIQQRTGKQFWVATTVGNTPGEDGMTPVTNYVRVATLTDGRQVFVMGEDEKGYAYVDETGRNGFLDKNSPDIVSYERIDLNDYLDSRVKAQDAEAEQQRMAAEQEQNLANVQQALMEHGEGKRINLGTQEEENWVPIVDIDTTPFGGIVVNGEGGGTVMIPWKDVATKLGVPFVPKTSADLVQERLSNDAKIEKYNEIPQGAELAVPIAPNMVASYRFRSAELIEGDIIIRAEDPETGNVVDLTPEMINNLDVLAQRYEPVTPDAPEIATPPTEEVSTQMFDDPAANELGISKDYAHTARNGQVVVNGSKLWNEQPRLWAKWNDANPNRVVPTKDFLESKIQGINTEVSKARTALEMEAKGNQDPDRLIELQEKLAEKEGRRTEVQNLLDEYNAAEQAIKEAAEAEERARKEAEERAIREAEEAKRLEEERLEQERLEAEATAKREAEERLMREAQEAAEKEAELVEQKAEQVSPRDAEASQRIADILSGKDTEVKRYKQAFDSAKGLLPNKYYDEINRQWKEYVGSIEAQARPLRKKAQEIGDPLHEEAVEEVRAMLKKHNQTIESNPYSEDYISEIENKKKKNSPEYQDILKQLDALNEMTSPEVKEKFRRNAIGMLYADFAEKPSQPNGLDAVYSMLGTTREQAPMDRLADKMTDIDRRVKDNPADYDALMDEKAAAIQEYVDIAKTNETDIVIVTPVNGVAEKMLSQGYPQQMVDWTIDTMNYNLSLGARPRSFRGPGNRIFMLAEYIKDAKDADTALAHEEEHNITFAKRDHYQLASMEGADRDILLGAIDGWVGYIPAYHGLSHTGVANEFISHAVERTKNLPEEEIVNVLNEAGVNSEEIANFIKNRVNERRDRSNQPLPANRGRRGTDALDLGGTEDGIGQNGRDSQQVSDRDMGSQGDGSSSPSQRGVESGEGTEPATARESESGTVVPQEITSIPEAAIQKKDGLDFSMATEEMVVQKIRDFAKTKEGKRTGWTPEQIEEIIKEVNDLINAIHASVSGNKFYDEWAKKKPTVKVDWRDGVEKPTVTWSRGNIEYKYDMSADLLCINNEGLEMVLASPTMLELMDKINEVAEDGFTSDDYLRLYETLHDMGIVVPCEGCFDAAMRFKMLPSVARKFVDTVNRIVDERNENPEAFDAALRESAGEKQTIGGLPVTATYMDDAIRLGVAGDNLTKHINWTQLMSAKGQTKALSDWGGIFRAWQRTGAGRPKDKLLPEPWTGEVVSSTTTIIGAAGQKTPSFRDIYVNQGTGLRRNSHSEFRPLLAIDEIQAMREYFIRNLTVFKYMKELDDVRLFGNMGVKYNISFFPAFVEGGTAAGLDANGDYIASEQSVGAKEFEFIGADGRTHYDGMRGWQEAKRYLNKDVSMSTVVFSVPHLIKALTDVPTKSNPAGEWGSLIPFHPTGGTKEQLKRQHLGEARAMNGNFEEAYTDWDKGVTNFEPVQNDRFGEGWEIVEGKKAGTAVEPGHKLEFASGSHYYNKDLGLHLYSSFYIYDNELKKGMLDRKGNIIRAKAQKAGHSYVIDYNDKVREIGGNTPYQDASDFYVETLRSLGLIPRFDFTVPENIFLQMCEAAKVDPTNPKLGWKGQGNDWSPVDSEGYYSLWCDYGMIDPATGKYSPHNPVGAIDENGNRVFKLPDDHIDIIKNGIERYSRRKIKEESRALEAIEEFAKRSVAQGKLGQKDADAILAKAREEASERPYGISKRLDKIQEKNNKVSGAKVPGMRELDQIQMSFVAEEPEDGIMFSLTKNNRATIEKWLDRRKDLNREAKDEVMEYLDKMDSAKMQLATAKWFTAGTIRIPEDMPKVEQAISVAEKAKVDPLTYDSPMALLEANANFKPTAKRINPDTVSTLRRAKEYPEYGIVIYDVEDNDTSRRNMREIINTHYGKDASPWCLLQGDGDGNLTEESEGYWEHYSGYPKQVAFKDGKLLAFSASANSIPTWWDREDAPHDGVPITKKVEGDELGRSAEYILRPNGSLYRAGNMFKGNRQNGTYQVWYDNGQLKSEIPYKDGKLHGTEIHYFENGNIHTIEEFKDGNRDGVLEFYKEDGRKMFHGEMLQDMRHGLEERWGEDGTLRMRTHYKHGLLDGLLEEWNEEGILIEFGQFKNGRRDGRSISYYGNGRLKEVNDYSDGQLSGLHEKYNPITGALQLREHYNAKHELDGVQETFHDDGTKYKVAHYKDGTLEGTTERYDKDGFMYMTAEFKNGQPHGVQKVWGRKADGSTYLEGSNHWKGGYRDGIQKEWNENGELVEMRLYEKDIMKRDLLAEGVTEEDADNLSFSFVTDEETLKRLEKEPTVTLYRAMAQIDGKLYPPMSTKEPNAPGEKGKRLKMRQPSELGRWEQADEAPDKAIQGEDGKWYFNLKKGNGGSVDNVLYNPYFHTSASPLNDQFTGAINYPELVTVAVEVPISEFSSGYKADKANDTVGPKDWHSGTVTGQIGEGRQVVLTRWAKPTRVIPDSEVAAMIAPKLIEKRIVPPANVFTPSLKSELEKRGVVFDGKPEDYPDPNLPKADDVLFSLINEGEKDIFISNAAKAVEAINMPKATPDQWLKMIEKNGGLKAGEDKWIGLSDWLKSQTKKTLTKDEVADYIAKNKIQIEEVHYSENGTMDEEELQDIFNNGLPPLVDNFNSKLQREFDELLEEMGAEEAYEAMAEKYGEKFYEAYDKDEVVYDESLDWTYLDPLMELAGFKNEGEYNNDRAIESTRLTLTTQGLGNKREIALTVPTIESWNTGDNIHFGDAGEGRAIAWVRFGETTTNAKEGGYFSLSIKDDIEKKYGSTGAYDKMTDEDVARAYFADYIYRGDRADKGIIEISMNSDLGDKRAKKVYPLFEGMVKANETGKRVLVIDEIQSKRHQEGREKGYRYPGEKTSYAQAVEEHRRLSDQRREIANQMDNVTNRDEWQKLNTEYERLNEEVGIAYGEMVRLRNEHGIPAAPFEKNWHELAMKRMLRYAAENGYDAVAWTTGDQQAERYDLGGVVDSIVNAGEYDGLHNIDINLKTGRGGIIHLAVNDEGVIEKELNGNGYELPSSDYKDKKLSEVIGKGLADKVMSSKEYEEISGEGLRVGGEGMKGFYDDILPRFMNKYGKKWGVSVKDISLPNLATESQIMHSVDVTPEMKASVMEGQPMFSFVAQDKDYLEVVEKGDMEKAQRMVDEAAEKAFPNSKVRGSDGKLLKVYHGTRADEDFTVFKGGYFAGGEDGEQTAKAFSIDPYLNKGNGKPRVYAVYLDIKNPYVMEDNGAAYWDYLTLTDEQLADGVPYDEEKDWTRDDGKVFHYGMLNDIVEWAKSKNKYDGVIAPGVYENDGAYGASTVDDYIPFSPEQIKLADPVTYDDNGEVIPLSKRFNLREDDIRFSMTNDKEANERLFKAAKERFGVTRDIREAGYVLPDGAMLDFSGRHWVSSGDTSWLNGMRQVDHRDIGDLEFEKDGNTPSGLETDMSDFIRRGAIRIDQSGSINLAVKPTQAQESALRRLMESSRGMVWIDFGDGSQRDHSVSYEGVRPERVINDIRRYFDEGVKPESKIMFSMTNDNQDIFVSNAAKAVEGIKNDKATPEQWLKQLEKNGGLKAGEDKWIGLSDWLKSQDKKSLTKQEVLDYINEHKIQIEETHYSNNEEAQVKALKHYQDEFDEYLKDAGSLYQEREEDVANFYLEMKEKYGDNYLDEMDRSERAIEDNLLDMRDEADILSPESEAYQRMIDKYGDDFEEAFALSGNALEPYTDFNGNLTDEADYYLQEAGMEGKVIKGIRLSYTTHGLENNHEIALTVPTIEPWNEDDYIHFGDAGEGTAVAWIRFGDASVSGDDNTLAVQEAQHAHNAFMQKMYSKYNVTGQKLYDSLNDEEKAENERLVLDFVSKRGKNGRPKRVLVIDEIQSKRHQEGREKGYSNNENIAELEQKWRDASRAYDEYVDSMKEKYGGFNGMAGHLTNEENAKARELNEASVDAANAVDKAKASIPAAPFEKNWHELAMKRMLRYAAENGYDAIAWTTGDQQAERYNLGKAVDGILAGIDPFGRRVMKINLKDDSQISLTHDDEGNITERNERCEALFPNAKNIRDIVGKEIAIGALSVQEKGTENGREWKDTGLRIGGEGMRGFYDDILPRFMNKYGKKWGVSVKDLDIPGIGETGNGLTMHSVDVTPEMRESVMEGQPMFSMVKERLAPNGKPSNLDRERYDIVRTDNFREFFGDWKNASIKEQAREKLRTSPTINLKGDEIKISKDAKEQRQAVKDYIKSSGLLNEYTNKDTGEAIKLTRGRNNGGVFELLQHDFKNPEHILSIAAVPQIIEESIFFGSEDNRDPERKPDIKEFQSFICGLNIGGTDYTVLSKVALDRHGNRYYDHKLTRIEKGKLLDQSGRVTNPASGEGVSDYNYKKLISIIQDPSKVIDENGEPLVVYKREHEAHNVLKTEGWGSFFSDKPISDKSFGNVVGEFFLDFKNPLVVDAQENSWSRPLWLELSDGDGNLIPREEVEKKDGLFGLPKEIWYHIYDDAEEYEFDGLGSLIRNNNLPYDGVIIKNVREGSGSNQILTDYIALLPNQIKSATNNNGEFSTENDDIRFSLVAEGNYDGKWKDGNYTYVGPKVQEGTPEAEMLDYIMRSLNDHNDKPWDAIGYVHNYISDMPQEVPTWTEEAANKFQPEMFLTKDQLKTEELIRSDSFKNWFGDWENKPKKASKVVDEDGKPLVVYHGTRQGRFTQFNESSHGIFFTSDEGVADDYAYYDNDYGYEDEDAMVVGAYLDIKKPFIIDADYYDWKSLPDSYNGLTSGSTTTDGWARYLMEQHGKKYDGLIVENVSDGYGNDNITTVYAVFKPSQIKSAEPVTYDDNGEVIPLSKRFNLREDDIRFSMVNDDVKAAAKKAMPNTKVVDGNGDPLVVYHGTPTKDWERPFTVFKGGHFTDDKEFATYYGNAGGKGYVYRAFLNIERPLVYDFKGQNSDFAKDENGNNISTWTIINQARQSGEYDGVILKNVDEYGSGIEEEDGEYPGSVTDYIPLSPNQIKSAEPVTYDDNGNVIPLSERFNQENDDIRFSMVKDDDEIYFSLRGITGAKNAGDQVALDNLDIAQEMEAAGKDAASIWMATGWEKGADGKWRNEIPDAKQKEGVSLAKENIAGDVLDAPELFKSYPALAKLKIKLVRMSDAGTYSDEENTIELNRNYNTHKVEDRVVLNNVGHRTLLHELQHAIQHIEGFAKGGSEEDLEKEYYLNLARREEGPAYFASAIARVNSARKLLSVGRESVTRQIARIDLSGYDDQDKVAFTKLTAYLNSIDDSEYRDLVRRAGRIVRDAREAGKSGYKALAGEVEARNVENRSRVNDEFRRLAPPSASADVRQKDQVVRFSMVRAVEEKGKSGFAEVIGGEENLDELYDRVYKAIPRDILAPVVERAMYDGFNVRKHVDAYLHDLAKNGTENDETGLLRALYDQVRAYTGNPDLTDNDIRYMIWKSTSNAKDGDILSLAEDIATRRRWGVGEDAPAFSMVGDFADSADEAREKYEAKVAEAERLRKEERKNIQKTFTEGLKPITKAMAAQKAYDKKTVDGIVRFAKEVMKEGNVDALSLREINRLLTLVNGATGKGPTFATRYSDELLDHVLDHIVKQERNEFDKLVKIKDKATSQSGVETLGKLDARGQMTMKAFRDGRDLSDQEIEDKLLDVSDRLSDPSDAVRARAQAEYEGLTLAQEYKTGIAESIKEANDLEEELELAREAKKTGNISKKAFDEYVRDTQEAIRENKMERVDLYREFRQRLAEVVAEGTSRAKIFREANQLRIEDIHHDANRDMSGTPTNEHRPETRKDRLINSDAARFFLKPLATFDQMLRVMGRKNMSGEGYLWNRYMRGWVDAAEKSYSGLFEATEELDKKVSEVFGKDMRWSDLYAIERKMPKATVRFMDGGEMVEHELTPGNLLYIYMANKMVDGRMKLRKMGIEEDDVKAIKDALDPRFIELADWVQEEFLVQKRNKYNEVHERMFGAPMADIQDYFPLKILSNARIEEVDLGSKPDGSGLSSTTTGSIIKRRKNSLALDLLHTDAFSLVIEHLEQMEDWAAFAEFRRDLNTLLSYKRFRNQVQNLNTIYGTGTTLWNNFKDAAKIASGQYKPKVGKGDIDTAVLNISKGVTAAKIAFRVNTAMKQVLSAPAFLPEVNMIELGKSLANPAASWNWCMENLPVFMKRWKSRIAGDTRLLDTDSDYKIWKNNLVKTASRLGMSPNAFVDAMTIAVGAKSIYETRRKRYLEDGLSETAADRKAKQDATILYNQTQQSAEGPFVSAMQLDRTFLSVMLTTFRNSSMGYQRQLHDAIRGLAREFDSTSKEERLDFMKRQRQNEGASEEDAARGAKKDYDRQKWRNLARVAIFGFGLQLLWNLGNDVWYLLFGKNDKKKKKLLTDASLKGLAGPIEGMAGGNIISDAWGSISSGEGTQYIGMGELPIVSDIKQILQEMEYDEPAAVNDIVNLVVQAGVGVNPETLTDTVVAIIDACNGDFGVAKEVALLMMRIAQIPQSTIDEFYIDELETTARHAKRMTPNQLAKRYAEYRLRKETPITNGLYDEKTEARRRKSYENRIKKKIKERKQ